MIKPTVKIYNLNLVRVQLGKGRYSIVKKGTHKSGISVAVKIITKGRGDEEGFQKEEKEIMNEINILNSLHHPGIINLHDIYDEAHHFYLVTDLMSEGDLHVYMKRKGAFTELEAKRICKPLLDAVSYMHGEMIVHRDLKPENILINVSRVVVWIFLVLPMKYDYICNFF